ncbi:MAG: DJ-1/PfpI family protein [Candidatus Micrarchaeia archaeon]
MKKIIFIIPPQNFRDEELFHTKEVLESCTIETKIASTKKGECIGSRGGIAVSTYLLEEINSKDFDGIIFIGGMGTPVIRSNNLALALAKHFNDEDKLVCAICWASTILAKAGVLKDKKATVWLGDDPEYNTTTDKVLERYGGIYSPDRVVADKNIITAQGPIQAREFGKKIAEKIILSH